MSTAAETTTTTPAHVAREHYSGMWAVVDTRTGDTRYLYSDRETAERVAAKQDGR